MTHISVVHIKDIDFLCRQTSSFYTRCTDLRVCLALSMDYLLNLLFTNPINELYSE